MVEQKAALRFIGVGAQVPGTGRFADGIPGPDGAGLHRFRVTAHAAHLAPLRLHPHPAAIGNALGAGGPGADEQVVVAVNLAQPGILRVPGVVHRHRALGDCVERVFDGVGGLFFQRHVIKRKRVEVGLYALAQMVRRLLAGTFALRRAPKALQKLGVDVNDDRVLVAPYACFLRPLHIAQVPVAHVLVFRRHLVMEHAVVLLVHVPLLGVGLAAHRFFTALAAPARQKAKP